ncbi:MULTISPECIES: thiamine/thiamine pyrophosphate ABC transporter permease ThiP [Vibrio]|uniref:Thiamine transport system permease protein ThiP n=1 Tax=Vibrio casei TaxID=673372 RepID=A0A368LKX3_9VIBR|nr:MULTISPECIES: thiamine/thiamine pyrophosphate ABC transporter permease ThiP [Vibrio]RCS72445.1 thiamine/thiamine pyrophosphate ABC transporter permease ThiP [Vibrio casei]SJN36715.1 Thiamin ABC transporter, transmembrane component [Vibrio casei]HBV76617.1 thiamine/thiamine pyrophosphate ABC transporter permease ThiP [Vibrio sp.]
MVNVAVPKLGIAVAVAIGLFVSSTVGALIQHAPTLNLGWIVSDPYYRHITFFSFYQAFFSTLLSIGFAIPVAHALSRREFKGKNLLLKIFASTLVLPVLVGVFGILAILGNSGVVADAFRAFDARLPFSIYGLNGILVAHVFFNLPYASRLLLHSLESIPNEQHKLCANLGMTHWQKFRQVEWPRLRQQLPQVAGLVFMLCFTSFSTVMALGGGPKSTTIELAIYQAIKFDFDLQAGAILALWQMVLCGVLSLTLLRLTKVLPASTMRAQQRLALLSDTKRAKIWDGVWIIAAMILVLPPLFMVVWQGLNPKSLTVLQDERFWQALAASIKVATLASTLSLLMGVAILFTSRAWHLKGLIHRAGRLELMGTIILVTPGIVVSTGLFLLLRNQVDVFSLAFWVVILVNSLMSLPYIIKTLSQPMLQTAQQYQFLCQSLGMKGWTRFRLVEWRALNKPIAHAFSISFMFSMGDLSAVALFGNQSFTTLPLYLFQLLGSYQMPAAAAVSLCLLLFSVLCFALIESVFKRGSR